MPDRDKHTRKHRDSAKSMPAKETVGGGLRHSGEETDRPDTPELEGGPPVPEELTGRASGTSEDLTALFDNDSRAHLADGFRGGSADEPSPGDQADGTTGP
jgi:hypothetical protein